MGATSSTQPTTKSTEGTKSTESTKESKSKLTLLEPTLKWTSPYLYMISEIDEKKNIETQFRIKNLCEHTTFAGTPNIDCGSHPLWTAMLNAYNYHGNVTLDPDILWMTVLSGFGEEVNSNPEQYRDSLVSHEGKKEIRIETRPTDYWDEFFVKMLPALNEQCKPDVIKKISAKFSTTTLPLEIIQTGYIMNGLKHYFEYACVPCCGIKSVHFAGTDDDWNLLLSKVKDIATVISCKRWSAYTTGMADIIARFIETKKGKFDLKWWRKVFDITKEGEGGSGEQTFYDGWILQLFYGSFDSKKIENTPAAPFFVVPVKLIANEKESPKIVKGGIIGVNYDKEQNLFTPVCGLGVFDGEKEEPLW